MDAEAGVVVFFMVEDRQESCNCGSACRNGERPSQSSVTVRALTLFGLVCGAVLFVVIVGEWFGLLKSLTERLPWYAGTTIVLLLGYPVFRGVVRSALRRRVTSHTLMTVGVVAALVVGEWATAAVVVFFMRVGMFVEQFTAGSAQRAFKRLMDLAPRMARVERNETETMVPAEQVQPGEIVVVRPGEQIPVDGMVKTGHATVNQSTITGESMPVEAGPGTQVYAATIATLGSIRVDTERAGENTTFGGVVRLVEQAESHRAEVQQVADRFSAWFLPIVAGIALVTFLLHKSPMAAVAVLVVACSCSFAIATPVAMLASIASAARRGLLIKGGKYVEQLARVDVVLIDKTGTLTLGRPRITRVTALADFAPDRIVRLAATAERYSEHPLAEAIREEARSRKIALGEPEDFVAVPGWGVRACVEGIVVEVGSASAEREADSAGHETHVVVRFDGLEAGQLAATDTIRPEVSRAIAKLKATEITKLEMLTGDSEAVAAALAQELGIPFRADLMPEDKIVAVRDYQAQGRIVAMVGDGVNDAPALAQADVGIAMGAAGSDIAVEAAHIALMRDDLEMVAEAFEIARRTMKVVRFNIGFTAVYNLIGISLAAAGLLPPVLAAAAQSLPDLGILANSSRLLHVARNSGAGKDHRP